MLKSSLWRLRKPHTRLNQRPLRTHLVVRETNAFVQCLPNEFGLRHFLVADQRVAPILPRPAELEVGQMVGEPRAETLDANRVHRVDALEQHF